MRVLAMVVLAMLLTLMIATVLVWQNFGVWGLVALMAGLVVGLLLLKWLVGRMFMAMFLKPLRMKSQVLRDAELVVHEITPAQPPVREEWDDEDELDEEDLEDMDPDEQDQWRREMAEERAEMEAQDAKRRWYYVDVTITPRPGDEANGFTHWEPGDLTLIDPRYDPQQELEGLDEDEESEEVGEIYDVEIWDPQQEEFCADEYCKYVGPQRLKMHVGVDSGRTQVALRYYFEKFGELNFTGG